MDGASRNGNENASFQDQQSTDRICGCKERIDQLEGAVLQLQLHLALQGRIEDQTVMHEVFEVYRDVYGEEKARKVKAVNSWKVVSMPILDVVTCNVVAVTVEVTSNTGTLTEQIINYGLDCKDERSAKLLKCIICRILSLVAHMKSLYVLDLDIDADIF